MKHTFLWLACMVYTVMYAQEPPRKAWIGITGSFSEKGMAIDTVVPGSSMDKIGVKKHDTLELLNSLPIRDLAQYNLAVSALRAGDAVSIRYKRNNKQYLKKINAVAKPYETSSLADITYGWVPCKTGKLRTITRVPKGRANVPAVLLIPGYNCGSIENFSSGIYKGLINAWLSAGYAVFTIEKSGIGDSYNCLPCSEADLVTDIQIFDAGYKHMEQFPGVDKYNLFIWGHSMGGVIAPEIAKVHKPRGVVVYATVFRPWSEFLLEMHRVQMPLDGKSYEETEIAVRALQKIYYEFFRLKRSPAELYTNPEYKDMVVSELDYKAGDNNMWGRHWRFWQQIDSLDLAASWSAVTCPVYSLFGGADYIACSELEHRLIVDAVNASHPGNAIFMRIPDIDHLLVQNKDWKEAHKNFSDKAYRETHMHPGFAGIVVKWMDSVKSAAH